MTFEELKEIFEFVFEINRDVINIDTSIKTLENWDSINHILLILSIENKTGIRFSPDQIYKMTSVKKILNTIRQCGKSFPDARDRCGVQTLNG